MDVRRLWKKNGKRPLPIEFDDIKLNNTWRPVGDNGGLFTSYIGTLVRDVSFRFSSWDKVPDEMKQPILPSIEVSLSFFIFCKFVKTIQ